MTLPELLATGDLADLADAPEWADFLGTRRWFPTGRTVHTAQPIDLIPLPGDDPRLAIAFLQVHFADGSHSVVQLVVGARTPTGGPGTILTRGGDELYEALTEPDAAPRLVAQIRASADLHDGQEIITFRATVGADVLDPLPTAARSLDAEQSNTSVVLDERMILKCYRRLEPGVHPELEILSLLAHTGFAHTPTLLGWFVCSGGVIDAALGVLTEFRGQAEDGWQLALDMLRAGRGQELIDRLRVLGAVTGELHVALAGDTEDVAFAPEDFPADGLALMCARLDEMVGETIDGLPPSLSGDTLRVRRDDVRDRIRAASTATGLGRRIRVHGDLHLGQALWCDDHWELIDFEGEPARSIAERRRRESPLRDVAGLVRSIGYADAVARADGASVPNTWVRDARAALMDGYLEAMDHSGLLPTTRAAIDDLLALHELEKAVYELRYELDHRPDWVHIPARAILEMIGTP